MLTSLILDSRHNSSIKESSPKSFGLVFAIVFFIVGIYPLINSKNLHLWALALSLFFLLLAYFAPKILITPNKLWFKFGILLGSIIAPIIMAIIYFFTVLPIGIFMRIIGKDLLKQKFDKSANSYWISRDEAPSSMRNQF